MTLVYFYRRVCKYLPKLLLTQVQGVLDNRTVTSTHAMQQLWMFLCVSRDLPSPPLLPPSDTTANDNYSLLPLLQGALQNGNGYVSSNISFRRFSVLAL